MQGDFAQVNGAEELEPKTPYSILIRDAHHHHISLCNSSAILTCDCKTGFLAQDCTILVLSKALIEPFI